MNDMVPWQELAQVASTSITRLVDWAQEADAAYSLAQRLTATAFCPEQFRGKPADAAAAMLAGSELGLSPLTALSAFDVIQGRAAARAITLRALVQAQGHDIVLLESTNTRCRMKGLRRGSSEWQAVTWTIDRAKDLNLTGKSNWKQQPQAMLMARATSEIARLVAADAILGIGYSAEEVADGVTGDTPAQVEQPARRTLSRTRTPAPAPTDDDADADPVEDAASPVNDVPPPPQEPDEPAATDGVTAPQLKKIGAAMRDLGITARDRALSYVAEVIGRDVASRNELTKAEAHLVIESLEHDLQQPPDGAS